MDSTKLDLLKTRAKFKILIREFFAAQDFLEVNTPLLVKNPGLEPNITYFESNFVPRMGKGERSRLYLPTSPEYHLKKILAWGAPRIFEMTKAFRNGELGQQHSPEFEMMEWYRQPGTYEDIATDVENLTRHMWSGFNGGKDFPKVQHFQVNDLVKELTGIDLDEYVYRPLDDLAEAMALAEITTDPSDSFEDIFHRIFLEKVDPFLEKQGLSFLWDFPAPLRALARIKTENKSRCARFEFYWGSRELGNAFDETTDPAEVEAVCLRDQARRMELYGDAPPLDQDFLAAHHTLQAPIGGIAMGLDRLLQWVLDLPELKDVIAFEAQFH